MKTEQMTGITDNSGAKILSSYHVKTLMLWACELQPRSLWAEDLNVVRVCTKLLCMLALWLNDVQCPHYFISNCNLIGWTFSCDVIAIKVTSGYVSRSRL